MTSLIDQQVHLIDAMRGIVVAEHVDEISSFAEAISFYYPLTTPEVIELLKSGAISPMDLQRLEFMAARKLASRNPGDAQPAPHAHELEIDGEKRVAFWTVTGWQCLKCKRTFYVGAKSQLVHAPCVEGADW